MRNEEEVNMQTKDENNRKKDLLLVPASCAAVEQLFATGVLPSKEPNRLDPVHVAPFLRHSSPDDSK